MNDIENLSKKILDDSLDAKKIILQKAEEEKSSIIAEAEKIAQSVIEEGKKKADRIYKEQINNLTANGESALKQEVLSKKAEIISSAIDKTVKKMNDIPEETYRKYFKSNLSGLDIKEGEFLLGKKEKKIDKQFIKACLKGVKLEESEIESDFDFGVKIMSGRAVYTISPFTEFEYQKDKIMMILGKKLFGEETN